MRFPIICALFPLLASAADRVTFTETIAPIVYQNCATCHRPGEAAPFSLISYDDVRKRGALIATVTQSRYMPPWHAEHGYGEFDGERRLTDAQIAAIGEWVKQGMPEGDRSKLPKLPEFTDGWHLGKPDLVLEMPAAYEVPASGPDIYRNFAIPTGLGEDKWVRAIEFRPSARKAVHHALFAYVRAGSTKANDGADGKPGFGGMNGLGAGVGVVPGAGNGSLGGWAVGTIPTFLAEGQGVALPKNSDLILQMHFHPTGKMEMERATIGLYFAGKAPDRKLIGIGAPAVFGLGSGLNIPAGARNYTIQDSTTLAADVRVFGVSAHAHYLGKEFKATATLPDGSVKPLLWIKDWDFNWQEQYNYKEPVPLPKGTRVDVSISYDNSAENPRNPRNPPKRVLWGEQSFDEMGGIGLMVVATRKDDEALLEAAEGRAAQAAIQNGAKDGTVKRYLESQARARAVATARLQEITIFDRQGKALRTVGEPGIYIQAAFSPDGTRIAAIKSDRQTGNSDVWVYDVASGIGTAITNDADTNGTPVWSPDGKQLAYTGYVGEGNYTGIYVKASDGTGAERLLHKNAGPDGLFITDWSSDGSLCFWTGDWVYLLPTSGETSQPVQLIKGRGGRFSADGRVLAYNSNETGRFEVYTVALKPSLGTPLKITNTGAIGALSWRADGKELLYLANPGQMLTSVDPTASAAAEFGGPGTPGPLFKIPPVLGPAQLSNVATPNAQTFVFLVQQPLTTSQK